MKYIDEPDKPGIYLADSEQQDGTFERCLIQLTGKAPFMRNDRFVCLVAKNKEFPYKCYMPPDHHFWLAKINWIKDVTGVFGEAYPREDGQVVKKVPESGTGFYRVEQDSKSLVVSILGDGNRLSIHGKIFIDDEGILRSWIFYGFNDEIKPGELDRFEYLLDWSELIETTNPK